MTIWRQERDTHTHTGSAGSPLIVRKLAEGDKTIQAVSWTKKWIEKNWVEDQRRERKRGGGDGRGRGRESYQPCRIVVHLILLSSSLGSAFAFWDNRRFTPDCGFELVKLTMVICVSTAGIQAGSFVVVSLVEFITGNSVNRKSRLLVKLRSLCMWTSNRQHSPSPL